MAFDTIFTIGRQFGSAGRRVGSEIAKKLNIPFYDKELISLVAKDSGLNEAIIENADEKAANSFFQSLLVGTNPFGAFPLATSNLGMSELPLNERVFLIQCDTIRKIADKGACVIVGRCADYVLRENRDRLLSAFITAPLDDRMERAINLYQIPEKKATNEVLKNDKIRAHYYNYFTDKKWGACENYDISIDSSLLGIEGTAQFLIDFDKLRREKASSK
ncbi:MAG: cytidylate kinase-like family protein [Spirochaetia bacterium]|jgi:cytidylate kinase|nr:cytidylate kinase-like family protein [Spirochaetia bacterium]